MNRLLILIVLCGLTAGAICAQNKAEIIVSYDEAAPAVNGGQSTNRMTLLASPSESKYFNDISLWNDSLSSTPEGKRRLNEIIMAACMTKGADGSMTFDLRKGPVKKIHTYVFTRPADNNMTVYGKWGDGEGYYTEPTDEQQWEIVSDSTETLLGYECMMAESDYHGRHWQAWFSPEIAVPFGPWKLHGLPGLILKAEADGGFAFTATGIEKTDRVISPIYSPDKYSRVDRLKALADEEYAKNNAEAILKARYGDSVKLTYDSDEEPVYDGFKHCIESDYKIKNDKK